MQQTSQPQQIITQRSPQPINQVQLVQESPPPAQNTQHRILLAIRNTGHNEWKIVAHLESQSDGTMPIVPINNQDVQPISQSENEPSTSGNAVSTQIQAPPLLQVSI